MFAMFFNFGVWVTDVFSAHHVHGVLGPGVPHEANGLPPPPLIDSVLVYPGRDFPGIFVLPSCGTEIILNAFYQIFLLLTSHKNSVVNAHSSEVDQTFRPQLPVPSHWPPPPSCSCSSSVPSKRSSVGISPPMPPTTTRAYNKPAITLLHDMPAAAFVAETWYSHWKY